MDNAARWLLHTGLPDILFSGRVSCICILSVCPEGTVIPHLPFVRSYRTNVWKGDIYLYRYLCPNHDDVSWRHTRFS